jgi:hypothetical protein
MNTKMPGRLRREGGLVGCIVHQKVDLSEFRDRSLDDGEAMLRVFDIAGHQDAFAACAFDQTLSLPGIFVFIVIAHQDIRTFACKRERNSTADPTVCTRDDRLFAG